MFKEAQRIASVTFEFMTLYIEAAFIYWLFCTVLAAAQDRLEKRLDRYVAH
ncbi:hypothetical protein GCM10022202_34180 [Microbacterium marinilacus]|uniref:Amino acid ABC transporter permease n=1 Tax=Microbacterium marinilacus TaxID=415209 RepID=A0ABP7BVD8_9MICO